MALLMSDDEYLSWWESKATACHTPCGICRTFSATQPLLGCHKHVACRDCRYHAAACNVSACPMCPPPPATYDILCCGQRSSSPTSCPCGKAPKLLRHFMRQGAYTNFITREEYDAHLNKMQQVEWSLMCPCGEAFDRHSACNEVVHCKTAVCGDCGAVALPGETLREHRRETGCVEWPTAASMAVEKERRRKHFECVVVQT